MSWPSIVIILALLAILAVAIKISERLAEIAAALNIISSARHTAERQRDEIVKATTVLQAMEEHLRAVAEPHYAEAQRQSYIPDWPD